MLKSKHHSQLCIWEEEHKNPIMFPFVNTNEPNPGVVEFFGWLKKIGYTSKILSGLDVCCGKGRNTFFFAKKGIKMVGFDFSETAINEAKRRKDSLLLPSELDFQVHDAVDKWSYNDHQFDFVIDCFGSSDIESKKGKKNILNETLRVLKPSGYYFLQIDSPEMGFFAKRLKESPGSECNTLVFPNGKVESFLTEKDIAAWNHPLRLVDVRRIIDTNEEIFGRTSTYKYFWIVAQSPEI